MATQRIKMITRKSESPISWMPLIETKGIAISRNSIGTIHVNGVALHYNLHLQNTSSIDVDREIYPETKKTIYLVRR